MTRSSAFQTTFNAETALPGFSLAAYRASYIALSADNTVCSVYTDDVVGAWSARVGMSASEYQTEFNALKAAGVQVVTYKDSTTILYIHAKVTMVDYTFSGLERVFMGSENYSTASLTKNRELGVYITGNTTVSNPIAATIAATIVSDETGSGVTKY